MKGKTHTHPFLPDIYLTSCELLYIAVCILQGGVAVCIHRTPTDPPPPPGKITSYMHSVYLSYREVWQMPSWTHAMALFSTDKTDVID